MLVVLDWLEEFINKPLGVDQVVEAMDRAGIEVEGVHYPPKFDDNIVTAEVLKVKDHPNADKLRLAEVSDGQNQYSVVCGAPNVAEGQKVVLVKVGSVLPGGQEITEANIRGEDSSGMLASLKELDLGDDHSGILVLDDNTPVGVMIGEIFRSDYTVIDIKTAANRPDLQSYHGIAIEIAAYLDASAIIDEDEGIDVSEDDDLFTIKATDNVPSYSLIKLKVDANKSAPEWMQRRLRLSGIKTVNVVVDITNYCMLVLGQPMHAFDASKIKGQVEVRLAQENEKLTTLDGLSRSLTAADLVIADKSQPIGLAGVMGGEASQINPDTKEIVLESATFDATMVRKTAQRHGLRTDASARFERNIPVQSVLPTNKLAVKLLKEHASAEVISHKHQLNIWPWVRHIGFRTSRFQQVSSLQLDKKQIVAELEKLHFNAEVFDIAKEAQKHLGKPYKLGARFKEDGIDAFDCSYLVDYIYSLIGVSVGHSALGQFELGTEIAQGDLAPGDVLFIEGYIDKSATDHYYISDNNGNKVKRDLETEKRVGHNGIYIGDDRVVMAARYIYQDGQWQEREEGGVIEVDASEFIDNPGYLGARRFVDNLDDYVAVTVPWWRPDVNIEADLFEEVVKTVGLDKLEATLPNWRVNIDKPDTYWHKFRAIRNLLRAMNLFEVTNYPFVSPSDIDLFNLEHSDHLKLRNPRSQEQSFLRTSLIPNLLISARNNQHYDSSFGLFEIAKVFHPSSKGELPEEKLMLAVVWVGDGALAKVKNCLDYLAREVGIDFHFSTSSESTFLHPARKSKVEHNSNYLGDYGQIHPDIKHSLKLSGDVAVLELEVQQLLSYWQEVKIQPIPKYQSSFRDLTLIMPKSLTWQDLSGYFKDREQIKVEFRDDFQEEGNRKVTIHVEILARDKTLGEEDIAKLLDGLEAGLSRDLGVTIEH